MEQTSVSGVENIRDKGGVGLPAYIFHVASLHLNNVERDMKNVDQNIQGVLASDGHSVVIQTGRRIRLFDNDAMLELARFIGLSGMGLLIVSSVGGVLLASRTAQRLRLFRGRTFKYHRLVSLVGAALFLLHPIPLILASRTTEMSWINVFVPFTAPLQTLWIGIGVIAAYLLIVVTVSSLLIKTLGRSAWRVLLYGTYVVLVLGLVHGLMISGEFTAGEGFDFDEPEKLLLIGMTLVLAAFAFWRLRTRRVALTRFRSA